jgi:hypothetical protein
MSEGPNCSTDTLVCPYADWARKEIVALQSILRALKHPRSGAYALGRAEALEEAARECEAVSKMPPPTENEHVGYEIVRVTAEQCADRIRALRDKRDD